MFGRGYLYALLIGTLALVSWAPAARAQALQDTARIRALLAGYTPVTSQRLLNPEDGNWLAVRRTYNGWGYSPIDQINVGNVARLRPVWLYSTGQLQGHEAPPIVNNGIMFVSTPGNQVIALEAATGAFLWRYQRTVPDTVRLHPTNRGVALYEDKVYLAQHNSVLVALDARTGQVIWSVTTADNSAGYYMTLSPLVVDGKVLVSTSGGEMGIRGFIAAFDAQSGREVWRTYTIPAPGEPGSETWPNGDQWMRGGGSSWVAGNYDPETNIVYWGIGNGGPWMGDKRPGDNLYTASTMAIDVATGAIKGHFQYHPNDSWDWDEPSPPLLIDFQRDGRTVRGLVNVARNGYIWWLERTREGPIRYLEGKPYIYQTTFRGLDPITGRPDVDPNAKPRTGGEVYHCPSHYGGKNWPPAAFNPLTRILYVPVNNNTCDTHVGIEVEYMPGRQYTGSSTTLQLGRDDHIGEVQAWNVDTGERVWTHEFERTANWGSMLTTAGGLVFTGGTNDRLFRAFDARTGEIRWQHPMNSGVLAPPVSFMVDGKQYISVVAGYGGDARAMQNRMNIAFWRGEVPPVPEGGVIWVFAVD